MKLKHVLIICFAAAMLTACGGSGGDGARVGNNSSPRASSSSNISSSSSSSTSNSSNLSSSAVSSSSLSSASLSSSSSAGFVGVSIRGTIAISPGSAVDGDTNDELAPFTPNNNVATVQFLSTPVTLGGYVTKAGAGAAGAVQEAGDERDLYSVQLLAGQTITLMVADPTLGDPDLYLFNEAEELVDGSINTGKIERLTVAESGQYFLQVRAYEGASNYILVIGQDTSTVARLSMPSLKLSDDFMVDQAIVKYHSVAAATGLQKGYSSKATALGFSFKTGAPTRAMLLELKHGVRKNSLRAYAKSNAYSMKFASVEIQAKWETLMAIKELHKDSAVVFAEPNYIYQPQAIPNDEYYPFQWHYPLINLPAAWDVTTGSPDVVVAVVDTGVLLNHPDMQGQLTDDGVDFISNIAMAADGDGADSNADDVGDSNGSRPSSFHGTHVAATIAGASNNSIGIAGVAWDVKIMPLRALGVGGGSGYDINQAVRYAAGLSNDYNISPDKPADIINLSLGGSGYNQSVQNTFNEIRNSTSTIVVAAAGNDGTNQLGYPASYDNVISVSAVGLGKNLAPYSTWGSRVDIAAPGGNSSADLNGDGYVDGVLSARADDSSGSIVMSYSFLQGTSMAAPHVAGVLALMRSVNPDITAGQIDNMLATGELTDDLGSAGRDDLFGHGLINAYKAVLAASSAGDGPPPPDDPVLTVFPTALNFSAVSEITIDLRNGGGGSLIATEATVTTSAPWLSMAAVAADATTNLGTYRVSVDRTGLSEGTYSTVLQISSNANAVQVPVIMYVGAADAGNIADAGTTYILLLSAETGESVAQLAVDASDGVYAYQFDNIPVGTYTIVAGSDRDQDDFICDAGESCAAYLTYTQPLIFSVENSDLNNLDFNIAYPVSLLDSATTSGVGFNARSLPAGYRINKHMLRKQ